MGSQVFLSWCPTTWLDTGLQGCRTAGLDSGFRWNPALWSCGSQVCSGHGSSLSKDLNCGARKMMHCGMQKSLSCSWFAPGEFSQLYMTSGNSYKLHEKLTSWQMVGSGFDLTLAHWTPKPSHWTPKLSHPLCDWYISWMHHLNAVNLHNVDVCSLPLGLVIVFLHSVSMHEDLWCEELMTMRTFSAAGCQIAAEMDTRASSEQNDTPKGISTTTTKYLLKTVNQASWACSMIEWTYQSLNE